jgi:hypothetical protein
MKLLADVRNLIDRVTESRTHPNTVRLFRRVIYGWHLMSVLLLLPAASEFWGTESLIPMHPSPHKGLLRLLDIDAVRPYYLWFLATYIVLLVVGMTCRWPRAVALLIYVVAMNLENRAWIILDGGDNLMQLMLIYLIFMDTSPAGVQRKPGLVTYANNAITNAAFFIARLQIVAVYLVAGLAKIDGELWQNGTALYYTLSVDDFTLPLARKLVAEYPFVSVAGSYSTLAYQVSFPWLIWNRKARPYLMSFGTFLHLQIALVMGLFSFGLAVMAAYAVFFTEERSAKILNAFASATAIPPTLRARAAVLLRSHAR